MSNIVTGNTMPADLLAVLKKYGFPELCTGFIIQCNGFNEPLLMTFKTYAMRGGAKDYPAVEETRTFKLLAVD